MDIIKYPMKTKTEKPIFNYMVRLNSSMDYYLYEDFDSAIKKASALSHGTDIPLIYEVYFNTESREFFGQNTFSIYDGIIEYDKHARVELHIEFYVNAGEWLNPNKDWLEILQNKSR